MKKQPGFSLIEVMVVVAVVAILASLAYPSYTAYVSKARRTDAQKVLLNMANDQAFWRSSNTTYATYTQLGSPTVSYYNPPVVSAVSSTGFSLSVTATAPQAGDNERGITCTPLTYALNGATVTKTMAS